MDKVQLYFQLLKEKLAYRYFFSIGSVSTNDLLRAQADVEYYFRSFYSNILFKNSSKKAI